MGVGQVPCWLGASGAVGIFDCKLVFQSVVVEPCGLERVLPSHSQHAVLVLVLGEAVLSAGSWFAALIILP